MARFVLLDMSSEANVCVVTCDRWDASSAVTAGITIDISGMLVSLAVAFAIDAGGVLIAGTGFEGTS